ncbi:MAG: hypothetical protein IPJ68_05430 [Candidatus Moraniibacteriota bacterium]|nr:MAG: hypothetical protein IPJ68_05430 [Candidatus Moranbacteria bacterium]
MPRPAYAWDAIPAELLGQAITTLREQLLALLKGIAKRVAIGLARDTANKLVSGGSSKKAAFITDYKEYIYGIALDEGMIYMNDLLTTVTDGKSSALNYVVAGGSLQQLGMSYLNYMNAEVNAAFAADRCKFNLDQYTPNAMVSLGEGDWRVLNAVVSVDCNNPLGMSLMIKEETQKKINQQQEIAKTKAIAGKGFTGVEINGKTVSPGSIIAGVTETTQTEVLKLVGNSTEWGELIAAAAGAFANQALNNMYQKGFEMVSQNISRELGKVDSKINEARTDLQRQLGPGSQFMRNSNQQLGGWSGSASSAGKYTGVQQSLVNFNSTPDPDP